MTHVPRTIVLRQNAMVGWVLDHPQISDWLKAALRMAEGCDLVAVQNDLEIMRVLIGAAAQATIVQGGTNGGEGIAANRTEALDR